MAAVLPANEPERLAALAGYGVMDTAPEQRFDQLTHAAGKIFNAPVSLISLVDERRQFFKSRIGVAISETPREVAFCSHTIESDRVLVVCDAAADERFAENPLVTGEMNFRFYAGAPLINKDGFRLGSLCVFDRFARPQPTGEQIQLLEALSAQAVELLEAGKSRRDLQALRRDVEGLRRNQFADREKWKRTQETAALALQAGNMGFWEWDALSGQGQWSERLFEIMKFPAEPAPPRLHAWLRRVCREDRAALLETIRDARRLKQTFTAKFRLRDEAGGEHSVTSVGNHYFDDRGTALGALGVSWDSSEGDRKERALAESEELFRGLSCSSPVGIFRSDIEGNMTFFNQRLVDIFGVPSEEVMGLKFLKRIHPEDRDEMREIWRRAVSDGRPFATESRLVLADGSTRWVQARCSILHDKNGKRNGLIGTVDDVTDLKRMFQEMQTAKEVAEVASRSKDLFLANTSHELRTPLNGVLGMTDLLLSSGLSNKQREMAEMVRDSGRSLLMLVNDILDLNKIEAGKLRIEKSAFDCNAVLRNAVALVAPEAEKKGIALDLKPLDSSLPRLMGDAGRMKQILLVYLTNAIKFTDSGSVTIETVAECVAGNTWELLFTVRDTGPGIARDDQVRLFKAFSQLDQSSTRKHGGVGLGLAISRQLAELMGGSVGVESALGQGAAFWLRLVLTGAPAAALPKTSEKIKAVRRTGRVLLVEDNSINQTVAASALRRLGWQPDVASDGNAAVAMVRKNEYALVLMDCQMPNLDGYGATQQIRLWEKSQNRPEVPIIALTAHAMTGDRERCLDVGMNDYLAKPFGLSELRSALERWCDAVFEPTGVRDPVGAA